MSARRGVIALMGSGELTSTMVEVHKDLLRIAGKTPRAVFLDTPAGFQLNADDLTQRAIRYFRDRVGCPMGVASFKSRADVSAHEAEKAYRSLADADFILMGPGSPTYAVAQWLDTPISEILARRVEEGACLTAASAAALTVGRFTLPVYEIYKVGQDLHWVDGIRLLDHFGFSMVVVPHWNNAEGGTHDTRFCYMGEPRFRKLESLLLGDVTILGLDEHTACLLDLEAGEGRVRGIGGVTLRHAGREARFERGECFSLEALRTGSPEHPCREVCQPAVSPPVDKNAVPEADSFWSEIQAAESAFEKGAEDRDPAALVSGLLQLDRIIWKGLKDGEGPEFIAQARERFRECIVRMGPALEHSPQNGEAALAPLVEAVLRLREQYRGQKRWEDADLLRQCLQESGLTVEDTPEGMRWRVTGNRA